jgi:hypothetical protein
MGTKFTYALVLTLISAAFRLLLYFTGFETEKLESGQYFQWLGFAILAVVLFLGIKAVRAEQPHQALTYGQGVGAGVVISLFSGLMSAVYNYIHVKFINTSFADYQMEIVRQKWADAGMSDAAMEQAEGVTRMMMGPGMTAVMTVVGGLFVGLVFSLIIAAILKRAAPADAEGPM